MSKGEVSAGLVLPYAAQAILGKGGSAAVLLLMFLSSTSAISAQLIAVSSIAGYDIFKTYFKRRASPDEILRVQEIAVVAFSLFMAAFGSLLHGVGVDLNFLYNTTGTLSVSRTMREHYSLDTRTNTDRSVLCRPPHCLK